MSGVVKVEQIDRDAGMALLGESWITQPVDDVFAQAFARHRIAAAPTWQPIETAPRDGTIFIGAYFNQPWAESHRNGQIVKCWFQRELGCFISGARVMVMAPGYTFEDGSNRRIHSEEREDVNFWLSLPSAPEMKS